MINQLDRVLRSLLIRDLPIRNGEVDIDFNQPKGKWSAQLSRPTLNLFLYDVRENTTLREPEWEIKREGNGKVTRQRKPVRLDLHYMITAWVADNPDNEHDLLARVLKVFFRHPCLPPPEDVQKKEDKDFWRELIAEWPEVLRDQPAPLPVRVAQVETLQNPAEIWSAMDNQLRPAITCTITAALNPYETQTTPLVFTRVLKFEAIEAETKAETEAKEDKEQRREHFWLVGGRVRSQEPLSKVKLILVERGLEVLVREDGRFVIGKLDRGDYTLELAAEGRRPRQYRLAVPSKSYDLEI